MNITKSLLFLFLFFASPIRSINPETIEIVKLKNGSEEALPIVRVTMFSIRSLLQENPIAFCELVMKARDDNHQLFGNTAEVLQQWALLDSRRELHESIRNVILSAVEGEGLNMELTNPVA